MARFDVTSKAKDERGFAHRDGWATIQPGETILGVELNDAELRALALTREFDLAAVETPPAKAKKA